MNTKGYGHGPEEPDDEAIRALLESAGPRPEVPRGDLEAITSAARAAFRGRARTRWYRRFAVLAAAALFVVAIIGGVLFVTRGRTAATLPVVAVCEVVTGDVKVLGTEAGVLQGGVSLTEGARIVVGEGLVALRVGNATSLRLARGTIVTLESTSRVDLANGSVYVDTGLSGSSLEVATPFGTARDIGTQFQVRVDPVAMTVAVREGEVVVKRGDEQRSVVRGEGLVLRGDAAPEVRTVEPWSDEWKWAMEAAPPFAIEGRTLAAYLEWVARETGLEIRYDDSSIAVLARETTLHGSTGGLPPGEAALVVLPGAGLEGEVVDGELRLRKASSQ